PRARVDDALVSGAALQLRAPKRSAERAFALAASSSRLRGCGVVVAESTRRRATRNVSSTARLKAISFTFDGAVKPDSLRTNWSDAAWTSWSVAGGAKLNSVLMLLHMPHFLARTGGQRTRRPIGPVGL